MSVHALKRDLSALHQTNVGGGLPPIAVGQSKVF
jgi:hypothetical protein